MFDQGNAVPPVINPACIGVTYLIFFIFGMNFPLCVHNRAFCLIKSNNSLYHVNLVGAKEINIWKWLTPPTSEVPSKFVLIGHELIDLWP